MLTLLFLFEIYTHKEHLTFHNPNQLTLYNITFSSVGYFFSDFTSISNMYVYVVSVRLRQVSKTQTNNI